MLIFEFCDVTVGLENRPMHAFALLTNDSFRQINLVAAFGSIRWNLFVSSSTVLSAILNADFEASFSSFDCVR